MRDPLESRHRPCHRVRLTPFSSSSRPGPRCNKIFSLYTDLLKEATGSQKESLAAHRKIDSAASSQTFLHDRAPHETGSERLGDDAHPSIGVTVSCRARRTTQRGQQSLDTQQDATTVTSSSTSDSSNTASIWIEQSLRPIRQPLHRSSIQLDSPERPRTPTRNMPSRQRTANVLARTTVTLHAADSAAGTLPRAFCRFRLCTCNVEYEDEETTTTDDEESPAARTQA